MRWSAWIMSLARCNMSGLVAVARRPDRGRSCRSVSPLSEALTLWTQRPTVLLSTAQLPYTAHNRYECSPHFLSPPLRIQLQLVVCNVCQTQTPFSQTTTAALSVGRPCTYICTRNISVAVSQFSHCYIYSGMRKKNVGHYCLSNPLTFIECTERTFCVLHFILLYYQFLMYQ